MVIDEFVRNSLGIGKVRQGKVRKMFEDILVEAGIDRVFGLPVERSQDLKPALEKAMASDKPAVVDVAVADYAHSKMMT